MFDLRTNTSPKWVETVLADIDAFLIDHASCERKASATAISFVVRYPDRKELVETMIEVAQDELEHFKLVTEKIHNRGLQLGSDQKDPYINASNCQYISMPLCQCVNMSMGQYFNI